MLEEPLASQEGFRSVGLCR